MQHLLKQAITGILQIINIYGEALATLFLLTDQGHEKNVKDHAQQDITYHLPTNGVDCSMEFQAQLLELRFSQTRSIYL